MRIVQCEQRSEQWDELRKRPTASEFDSFVTPAKGQYSAQATGYAAKIVAKRLGVYTEPPPSYWMEWGTEQEPNAKHAYERATGREVVEVGFILPDHTDDYGGSPDGLAGDGLLEIKCPAPETLIAWHARGELPIQYRPQIQGLLLISGRDWCDFMGFHPLLSPFVLRVESDPDYQLAIVSCLGQLLDEIAALEAKVRRVEHELVSVGTMRDNVRFDDE